MKHTVKLIISYIFYGISLGCTFFVIMCLSYFIGGGTDALMDIFNDFGRQSVGAMLVGVACGGPAVLYQFDRPSGLWKLIIHFCVGMGIFYPVAIYLGWFPFHPDRILFTILQFLFSCGIFMVIWFVFYLFHRNEAKMINKRLKELERENASGDS